MEHNAFIEKLEQIDLNKVDEDHEKAILDLLEFLTNRLVYHILEKDMLIGK